MGSNRAVARGKTVESDMKTLIHNTRGMSQILWLNTDRLLVPLLIVAALVLGSMIFSHAMHV
jgi:hypothetical protein